MTGQENLRPRFKEVKLQELEDTISQIQRLVRRFYFDRNDNLIFDIDIQHKIVNELSTSCKEVGDDAARLGIKFRVCFYDLVDAMVKSMGLDGRKILAPSTVMDPLLIFEQLQEIVNEIKIEIKAVGLEGISRLFLDLEASSARAYDTVENRAKFDLLKQQLVDAGRVASGVAQIPLDENQFVLNKSHGDTLFGEFNPQFLKIEKRFLVGRNPAVYLVCYVVDLEDILAVIDISSHDFNNEFILKELELKLFDFQAQFESSALTDRLGMIVAKFETIAQPENSDIEQVKALLAALDQKLIQETVMFFRYSRIISLLLLDSDRGLLQLKRKLINNPQQVAQAIISRIEDIERSQEKLKFQAQGVQLLLSELDNIDINNFFGKKLLINNSYQKILASARRRVPNFRK